MESCSSIFSQKDQICSDSSGDSSEDEVKWSLIDSSVAKVTLSQKPASITSIDAVLDLENIGNQIQSVKNQLRLLI